MKNANRGKRNGPTKEEIAAANAEARSRLARHNAYLDGLPTQLPRPKSTEAKRYFHRFPTEISSASQRAMDDSLLHPIRFPFTEHGPMADRHFESYLEANAKRLS